MDLCNYADTNSKEPLINIDIKNINMDGYEWIYWHLWQGIFIIDDSNIIMNGWVYIPTIMIRNNYYWWQLYYQ